MDPVLTSGILETEGARLRAKRVIWRRRGSGQARIRFYWDPGYPTLPGSAAEAASYREIRPLLAKSRLLFWPEAGFLSTLVPVEDGNTREYREYGNTGNSVPLEFPYCFRCAKRTIGYKARRAVLYYYTKANGPTGLIVV